MLEWELTDYTSNRASPWRACWGGQVDLPLLISFFYFAQLNQKLFFFLRSLEYFALVQRIVHFFC